MGGPNDLIFWLHFKNQNLRKLLKLFLTNCYQAETAVGALVTQKEIPSFSAVNLYKVYGIYLSRELNISSLFFEVIIEEKRTQSNV